MTTTESLQQNHEQDNKSQSEFSVNFNNYDNLDEDFYMSLLNEASLSKANKVQNNSVF